MYGHGIFSQKNHDCTTHEVYLTFAGPTKVNVIPTMAKIQMLAGTVNVSYVREDVKTLSIPG